MHNFCVYRLIFYFIFSIKIPKKNTDNKYQKALLFIFYECTVEFINEELNL